MKKLFFALIILILLGSVHAKYSDQFPLGTYSYIRAGGEHGS